VTNKAVLAVVGAILTIAYFMDYANTFHSFASWTMNLAPSEATKGLYGFVLSWFQPVVMAGYSVPLALVALFFIVLGLLLKKR
jgi:hypothetical protein